MVEGVDREAALTSPGSVVHVKPKETSASSVLSVGEDVLTASDLPSSSSQAVVVVDAGAPLAPEGSWWMLLVMWNFYVMIQFAKTIELMRV